MSFELLQFNGIETVLSGKAMQGHLVSTLEYLDTVLSGTVHRRELLREALSDMDWRGNLDDLRIIEGRRYLYDGFRQGIALEANFSAYEYLLTGLFRLQVGYDKGLIEAGVLLLTGKRGEKSPYGSSAAMVREDLELLNPTINLPVAVVLFDLGQPRVVSTVRSVSPVSQPDGTDGSYGKEANACAA